MRSYTNYQLRPNIYITVKMKKILSINPGSTSTKIAVYENENPVFTRTISHSVEELNVFSSIFDQYAFRKDIIINELANENIVLNTLSAIVGRGGLLRPVESGVYEVNQQMLDDVQSGKYGEHASNLGALLAYEIAKETSGCRSFIADPVVVDELQDVARISGLPQIPRRSIFHALNQKAIARKYAGQIVKPYESLNLVLVHMGGGISVSAHKQGKVVDTNQALGGFGPFSPERAGILDGEGLVNLCFSGKYTQAEIKKLLVGQGGLVAHLGTNEARVAAERAKAGDKYARLVLEAMAYNIAKEIGSMLVVLQGKANAVLLTGGIAHNTFVVSYIKKMVEPLINVFVFPGEDEMEALALAGLRVLNGEEPKLY